MKKIYFVTLAGEIREEANHNDPSYDFEISATEDEIEELRSLMTQEEDQDFITFIQAHIPYNTEERLKENVAYDGEFKHIIQKIYQLGTNKTREKIRKTSLLELT